MFGHDSKPCRKHTKQIWMEKKKSVRETTENVNVNSEEKNPLEEGVIHAERQNTAEASIEVVAQNGEGQNSAPRSKDKDDFAAPIPDLVDVNRSSGVDQIDNPLEKGEWTPVCTRRKAQQKILNQKGGNTQMASHG
ncbi:hypothetical protein RIF29_14921 [Crotalaria pallida]|uniref:Uncharacterized protein n=1 Tax=Crotalaria pallida TaxID=3830 RepID=A0AAN9FCI9_CROPI